MMLYFFEPDGSYIGCRESAPGEGLPRREVPSAGRGQNPTWGGPVATTVAPEIPDGCRAYWLGDTWEYRVVAPEVLALKPVAPSTEDRLAALEDALLAMMEVQV